MWMAIGLGRALERHAKALATGALHPAASPRSLARAEMAPASRLAARLFDLSHAQLLEIAAAGCEASTEVKNRADAILAVHKPLAQWAVEGVLLSSDLLPHLLAPLQLQDGAAAAVCSQWANGWKATSEGRRRLTRVAFDFPQDLLGTYSLGMAVIPGGDEQLAVRSDYTVRILARDMSSNTSFELPSVYGDFAASEQFLYVTECHANEVRCLTHDGTEVASYEDQDKIISCVILAPGGLLFCVLSNDEDYTQDEIIALDAQTLQPRYRFGLSLLKDATGLVVVGEELFVCDKDNDRLQVFSLAGEHRRSITGEWKRPAALCLVDDRLYLVEENDEEEDEEGELINPLCGRRILALSLQGDTLQVFTIPIEAKLGPTIHGDPTFWDICYFDGKLLTIIKRAQSALRPHELATVAVLALIGC
jgi:hypothetical protein